MLPTESSLKTCRSSGALVFGLPSISINIRSSGAVAFGCGQAALRRHFFVAETTFFACLLGEINEHQHLSSWILENPERQRCLCSTRAIHVQVNAGVAGGHAIVNCLRRCAPQFE